MTTIHQLSWTEICGHSIVFGSAQDAQVSASPKFPTGPQEEREVERAEVAAVPRRLAQGDLWRLKTNEAVAVPPCFFCKINSAAYGGMFYE
ncbi:hypothetical protein DPEC_G00344700 [Dallia pectoralis]|uniref:Uncharacterized protein n=1 Tax=Dallia pectoralis TaxID=75939 RepID=A0ACC2F3Q1_DALPE|nr:hypothetical protein DPEC_G00344700 [Dallia pectoralis]